MHCMGPRHGQIMPAVPHQDGSVQEVNLEDAVIPVADSTAHTTVHMLPYLRIGHI